MKKMVLVFCVFVLGVGFSSACSGPQTEADPSVAPAEGEPASAEQADEGCLKGEMVDGTCYADHEAACAAIACPIELCATLKGVPRQPFCSAPPEETPAEASGEGAGGASEESFEEESYEEGSDEGGDYGDSEEIDMEDE